METYGVLKPLVLEVEFKEVDNLSLEVLREEVKGYIECVYEGLIINLPPNLISRAGTIHGNIVFCRHHTDSGDLVGLNQNQINLLKYLTKKE